MKLTILGCGGSGGVPTISQGWGACNPADDRNRRRRPAILVQSREKGIPVEILVDTPPDLRNQLLDVGIRRLDAVLYTHAHADHVHGLDDLREINRAMKTHLSVYATPYTLQQIVQRFQYAFITTPKDGAVSALYKPVLRTEPITGPFRVHGMTIVPFEQDHGFSTTLGFRFGNVAYSTDLVGLSEKAFTILTGIKVWIVSCFTTHKHQTHASLETVLQWVRRIRPQRTILTHMGPSLDYAALQACLPPAVEPAFDGMIIEC